MNLREKRAEFQKYVWNHSQDPFQLQFDVRRVLTDMEIQRLSMIAQEVKNTPEDADLATHLKSHILADGPALTAMLLQLTGLTRSKILTDMKALGGHLQTPSSYGRLHLLPSWEKSGPYLAANVRRVFQHVAEITHGDAQNEALEALNQATYPGFIRQERAKRQGHEAEYRLAVLLKNCGLPFQPVQKAENPLCPDKTIHSISFDLVVPSADAPVMVVKSTVHTSNIGQYGESKDDLEIREAKKMLEDHFSLSERPVLLALIDGVGFNSNRAGLDGVLSNADEFCQFSTLWKAVLVAANCLNRATTLFASDEYLADFAHFLARYPAHTVAATKTDASVEAGGAFVEVSSEN